MRKISFLIVSILFTVLAACKENEHTEIGENSNNASISVEADFVMGTDDQPDCDEYMAYTENGYYFLVATSSANGELSGWMLNYYDYESNKQVPVCGKADCNHDNESCNAYFDRETYPLNNIWYYNEKIYVFCIQKDYCAIESVSKDGAERSMSCTLYRTNVESETDEGGMVFTTTYYPEVMLHRGYAYFSTYYPGNKECGLYRVELDSSENAEQLCVQKGDYPILYRLKGYGDNVFFQKGNFIDEEGTKVDINLYAWNLEAETVKEVAQNIVRDYTVGTDCIYYFDLDNLDSVMKYDLASAETQMIFDSNGTEALVGTILFVKEGDLYYSTSSFQYVFDESGEQIDTLKGDDMVSPYSSDGE